VSRHTLRHHRPTSQPRKGTAAAAVLWEVVQQRCSACEQGAAMGTDRNAEGVQAAASTAFCLLGEVRSMTPVLACMQHEHLRYVAKTLAACAWSSTISGLAWDAQTCKATRVCLSPAMSGSLHIAAFCENRVVSAATHAGHAWLSTQCNNIDCGQCMCGQVLPHVLNMLGRRLPGTTHDLRLF
jgi:hypothetical protein